MPIRTYKMPIPRRNSFRPAGQPEAPGRFLEMYVILEEPLLEFNEGDLGFLSNVGIDWAGKADSMRR